MQTISIGIDPTVGCLDSFRLMRSERKSPEISNSVELDPAAFLQMLGEFSVHHSLINKQLFNFSENRRPEVVFIGVNYVTFVSGYDPSANLSVVVWCFVVIQQNFSVRLSVKMISLEQYRLLSVCTQVGLGALVRVT